MSNFLIASLLPVTTWRQQLEWYEIYINGCKTINFESDGMSYINVCKAEGSKPFSQ